MRYIKAIPIEGALAACGKGAILEAASKASSAAEQPVEHAACEEVTGHAVDMHGKARCLPKVQPEGHSA